MPQLGDVDDQLLRAGKKAQSSAGRFWDGFTNFVFNDNVLEVIEELHVLERDTDLHLQR